MLLDNIHIPLYVKYYNNKVNTNKNIRYAFSIDVLAFIQYTRVCVYEYEYYVYIVIVKEICTKIPF